VERDEHGHFLAAKERKEYNEKFFICLAINRGYIAPVIRNIIFDWSGTLVDDLPAVWKATNFVLAQADRPEMSLEEFRAEFSLPFTKFYGRHTPHVPLPQLENWFHSHYRGTRDTVHEVPYARQFLKFCRAKKIRTFLLSTVHRDHFAEQCRLTGFGVFFDKPYTGVLDKRKKIREILGENHLRPDETLFIGDMEHDIETARHGGIHSCAVLTGYNTLRQLRAARPDLIVEHLGELRRILEQSGLELRPRKEKFEDTHLPQATVGALIFNDAGEVLMIRTHKWSDLWGIPGGKIKWGELSLDALRREIREETGLRVADIQFVLEQDCIHSKEFYRDAHFVLLNYICRCAGKQRVRLNEEARESCWVKPAEALKLRLNTPTRVLLEAVFGMPAGAPARPKAVKKKTSPGRERTSAQHGSAKPPVGVPGNQHRETRHETRHAAAKSRP
jgi:phosphoglycolate phosphatase-like HAD superfamily hydrolase/ADP-ribose pyrophosphatase YjhB (NUDIX family)